MTRKLPLLASLDPGKKPTVDAIRAKLGGRASTETGAGDLVTVDAGAGLTHTGIIIYTRGEEVDVWTGEGVVRRARWSLVRRSPAPIPDELRGVSADAAVFGGIAEGQRVRYRHDTGTAEGTVVEKCKFGALVERDDRTLVGVSFRRLWPAEAN
ncbi:MAG: hypothetical protein R3B70_15400 [Polyangiaceae bacterium]